MEEPPTRILVQEVAGVMQEYTQSGWVGICLLLSHADPFVSIVVFVPLVYLSWLLVTMKSMDLPYIKSILLVHTGRGKQALSGRTWLMQRPSWRKGKDRYEGMMRSVSLTTLL
jgi:hypothetical protein